MTDTDTDTPRAGTIWGRLFDPEIARNPQPMFKVMRDSAPVDRDGDGRVRLRISSFPHDEVIEALRTPEVFSSQFEAVQIGQVRPLIPLQVDPPGHGSYRKVLDPLFAPKRVALLEPRTRELVRGMIDVVADDGQCNFNDAVAEPLPSTVFLDLLGLPISRTAEFLELKDGILRPPAHNEAERRAMVDATGAKIYAVLEEVIDARMAEPQDDFISGFLTAEVDGHVLSREEIIDICYLFFLAGLDTVTASLDCMLAYLAQHPDHRRQLVDDPSLIPHAIEELLRWETPVPGVVRMTTEETELGGCPIPAGKTVTVLLASANTDESSWERADEVDFHREINKHVAFGGGVHRCLGSHLARMELRVTLEEWHARVPEYSLAPDTNSSTRPGSADRRPPARLVAPPVEPERRMLIGGKLIDAQTGATFDNINPATEEVLGVVADGTHDDMARAVDAARRAFDTTAWATDRELRKACLAQLQTAIEGEQEQLREELVAEVGMPGAADLRAPTRRPGPGGAAAGRRR